jgi:hypothetical protein
MDGLNLLTPILIVVLGVWGRSHHNEACRIHSVENRDGRMSWRRHAEEDTLAE